MTRKDYQRFAAVLSYNRPTDHGAQKVKASAPQWKVWLGIAEHISDILKADNPRFDRDRFMQAANDPGYWKGRL